MRKDKTTVDFRIEASYVQDTSGVHNHSARHGIRIRPMFAIECIEHEPLV